MKKLCLLLIASAISTTVLAQTTPVLKKEWAGTLTLNSVGSTTINNPNHKSNNNHKNQDIHSYTQPRKLIIKKQDGRNLEMLVKGPKTESLWIGTLSEDGKEMVYASNHAAGLAKINGNKMSGCGTSRGIDGNFEHWLNSYAAWCWEFTAVE
jgi:hypothetical protein